MRACTTLLTFWLLSGCSATQVEAPLAAPRLYPVCFYNQPPSQKVANEYYLPRLQSTLQQLVTQASVMNLSPPVDVVSTPDGRWLVARTTEAENEKLARVWPRIGCIGTALDSPAVRREADCVAYLSEFVSKRNYFQFGNAKDAGGIDIWSEAPDNRSVVHCYSPTTEGDSGARPQN